MPVLHDEDYITLDESKRELIVPPSQEVIGVFDDNQSDRLWFKFPRVVGYNLDVANCYIVANYKNLSGKVDIIICEHTEITDDYVVFSMPIVRSMIDQNADGRIQYSISLKNVMPNGFVQSYGTVPAYGKVFSTIIHEKGG